MKRLLIISFTLFLIFEGWYLDAYANTYNRKYLKIALVHFNVKYKKPKQNLISLEALHRKAANQGAKIIFNAELAVTGYSFSSRSDVGPYTQTDKGNAVDTMIKLAKELKVYIGITFPERDSNTGIYYNTAVVISPHGKTVCKYRKISCYLERTWARPGSPYQDGIFDTPWGRFGVAICSDSYFGLIPRTMALKGVDLLWVPATWPSIGELSPLNVWQARAIENGFYLVACNRTGKEPIMDCSKAISAVIAPDGTPMVKKKSQDSSLLFANIPLNENGQISSLFREERMAARNVDLYRQIYIDPLEEDSTRYDQLPKPGKITVHSLLAGSDGMVIQKIIKHIKKSINSTDPRLWVLPMIRLSTQDEKRLIQIAKAHNGAFALNISDNMKDREPVLITGKGIQPFVENKKNAPFSFKLLKFGPAVIAMIPMTAMRHPELGIVMEKLRCDIVLVSEIGLSSSDMRIGTIRTSNGLSIAASSFNTAFVAQMDEMRTNLKIVKAQKPGFCTFIVDTKLSRKKIFFNRIDFDRLLKK